MPDSCQGELTRPCSTAQAQQQAEVMFVVAVSLMAHIVWRTTDVMLPACRKVLPRPDTLHQAPGYSTPGTRLINSSHDRVVFRSCPMKRTPLQQYAAICCHAPQLDTRIAKGNASMLVLQLLYAIHKGPCQFGLHMTL